MSRRRMKYLAWCEATRILTRLREGYDDEGVTPELVAWCLEQTGDL